MDCARLLISFVQVPNLLFRNDVFLLAPRPRPTPPPRMLTTLEPIILYNIICLDLFQSNFSIIIIILFLPPLHLLPQLVMLLLHFVGQVLFDAAAPRVPVAGSVTANYAGERSRPMRGEPRTFA